ncbi:type II secretion system (T2SS), L family protein, partial [Vibrio parahaemolyticus V-223/04]
IFTSLLTCKTMKVGNSIVTVPCQNRRLRAYGFLSQKK